MGGVEGCREWEGESMLDWLLPYLLLLTTTPGVWFPDYSHGITLVTPLLGSEKRQVFGRAPVVSATGWGLQVNSL